MKNKTINGITKGRAKRGERRDPLSLTINQINIQIMKKINLASHKEEFNMLVEEFDMGLVGNADIVSWFVNQVVFEDEDGETPELYKERNEILAPLADAVFKMMKKA